MLNRNEGDSMDKNEIAGIICQALNSMDRNYWSLSVIDYQQVKAGRKIANKLREQKFLERPVAYEFYHQLRTLLEENEIDLGGHVVQAEVDKRYQHVIEKKPCPDFLIHIPNSGSNLAVIEFKLASRKKSDILEDIDNLQRYIENEDLKYEVAMIVLIGVPSRIKEVTKEAVQYIKGKNYDVSIIGFNVESEEAKSIELD